MADKSLKEIFHGLLKKHSITALDAAPKELADAWLDRITPNTEAHTAMKAIFNKLDELLGQGRSGVDYRHQMETAFLTINFALSHDNNFIPKFLQDIGSMVGVKLSQNGIGQAVRLLEETQNQRGDLVVPRY